MKLASNGVRESMDSMMCNDKQWNRSCTLVMEVMKILIAWIIMLLQKTVLSRRTGLNQHLTVGFVTGRYRVATKYWLAAISQI